MNHYNIRGDVKKEFTVLHFLMADGMQIGSYSVSTAVVELRVQTHLFLQ